LADYAVRMGPREAFHHLVAAADDGRLPALCDRNSVEILTAFGSAIRDTAEPSDLDIAVRFRAGAPSDMLALIEELAELTGSDDLDVMDLDRADPVARSIALTDCEPLFEATNGGYVREQIRAVQERLDTAWLRSMELERLAS